MTAALLFEQGLPHPFTVSRPLRIERVELHGPGPGEVLIEVAAAGLCHSDLSTIEGVRPRKLPTVVGHEGAGVIGEVGASAQFSRFVKQRGDLCHELRKPKGH